MSPLWTIELFGGLRIRRDGQEIQRFRTQKVAGLLGYLVSRLPLSHSREHLVELFWPEVDLDKGQNGLRVSLSSLRRQLEPPGVLHGSVIQADRTRVGINPDSVATDVQAFEESLRKAGQAAHPLERHHALQQAVDLYKGLFLEGLYDDWVFPEQERLTRLYMDALRQLIAGTEEKRDFQASLRFAHMAAEADPLSEEAQRDLIRLYGATGQPSFALRHYRDWEGRLREELGSVPSSAMRQLIAEIQNLQQLTPPKDASFRPQPPLTPPRPPLSVSVATLLMASLEGGEGGSGLGGASAGERLLSLAGPFLRQSAGSVIQEADGVLIVAFGRVRDAVSCGLALHQATEAAGSLPGVNSRRLKIAMDTRETKAASNVFDAPELHDALYLLKAARAGQILCSERTASLLQLNFHEDFRLKELGIYRLQAGTPLERLYQLEWETMPIREFPPPQAEIRYTSFLPPQFTRFFGREGEQLRLAEMLRPKPVSSSSFRSGSLVTLTGIGGCGKTRLALEVSGQCVEAFQGAVWFVPLADLRDPGHIFDAILSAMRLPRSSGREALEQVVEVLQAGPSLLVLDNFEQLVETGTPFVRILLERIPALTCLVTSRRLLGLEGEREFFLKPLSTPEGEESLEVVSSNESVRLFVDRAQAVRSDFQVTPANADVIVELCHRLEGIPLALELAAARTGTLTPPQMLAQLAQRYDLLISRRRDISDRHRTLRAAVDWSFQMLPEDLRHLLTRLSVFRGGWTLDAAQAICTVGFEENSTADWRVTFYEAAPPDLVTLEGLESLRECSLLHVEERNGEIRYSLLETIREYAWERLEEFGETEKTVRRHLEYHVVWMDWLSRHVNGPEQDRFLPQMDAEQDNCRAAMEWGLDHAPERALALASEFGAYWLIKDAFREGKEWLKRMLQPGISAELLDEVRALRWLAVFEGNMGYLTESEQYLRRALKLSDGLEDKEFHAAILCDLGEIATYRGEYDKARAFFQGSFQLRRFIRQSWGMGDALMKLGGVDIAEGKYETAQEYLQQSFAILQEHGNPASLARIRFLMGTIYFYKGDLSTASALFEESLNFLSQTPHQYDHASCLKGQGDVALQLGEIPQATRLYGECLARWQEIGNRDGTAAVLEGFARIAASEGRGKRSARLFGAAQALRRVIQSPLPPNERPLQEGWTMRMRKTLGEDAFQAAFGEGQALSGDQAAAYALE